MRKIYFAGSIRGGRKDQAIYAEITALLKEYGSVLTEHLADAKILGDGESRLTDATIFSRDMTWLSKADIVVAEVTMPSLGVGYELGRAEAFGKRTLCIYRPVDTKWISAMVGGNPAFLVHSYTTMEELRKIFNHFFGKA